MTRALRKTFISPLLPAILLAGAISIPPAAIGAGPSSPASNARLLRKLSRSWAEDERLTDGGRRRPQDRLSECPGISGEMSPANRPLVPDTFVPFEGIATHACDAVLWVFLGCAEAYGESCTTWRERLILETGATHSARTLGDIQVVKGANNIWLWVPFAFTKDDRSILVKAWMGAGGTGVGGSLMDFGWGLLSTSDASKPLEKCCVEPLAPSSTVFYDDFAGAIALGNSGKSAEPDLPRFPYRSNDGAVLAIDLATRRKRILLEEPDRAYRILKVDESKRLIRLEVTKRSVSSAAEKTVSRRTIPLPDP
jgi:hypothetical protein